MLHREVTLFDSSTLDPTFLCALAVECKLSLWLCSPLHSTDTSYTPLLRQPIPPLLSQASGFPSISRNFMPLMNVMPFVILDRPKHFWPTCPPLPPPPHILFLIYSIWKIPLRCILPWYLWPWLPPPPLLISSLIIARSKTPSPLSLWTMVAKITFWLRIWSLIYAFPPPLILLHISWGGCIRMTLVLCLPTIALLPLLLVHYVTSSFVMFLFLLCRSATGPPLPIRTPCYLSCSFSSISSF